MPENIALWGSLGFLAGVIVTLIIGVGDSPGKAVPVPRATVVECRAL
jgi:hypothetical protein